MKKKAVLNNVAIGLIAGGLLRDKYVRDEIERDLSRNLLDKKVKSDKYLYKLQYDNPYITIEKEKDPSTGKEYKRIKRKLRTYILPALGLGSGLALLGLNAFGKKIYDDFKIFK